MTGSAWDCVSSVLWSYIPDRETERLLKHANETQINLNGKESRQFNLNFLVKLFKYVSRVFTFGILIQKILKMTIFISSTYILQELVCCVMPGDLNKLQN